MSRKLMVGLLIFLSLTVVETSVFLWRAKVDRVVPVILPCGPDGLRPPPPPGGPRGGVPDGSVAAPDGVARGLSALQVSSSPALRLTPAQAARLLPLAQEAASATARRAPWLRQQERLQATLARAAVDVLRVLTPAQVEGLVMNRDETERLLRDLPALKARLSTPAGGQGAGVR